MMTPLSRLCASPHYFATDKNFFCMDVPHKTAIYLWFYCSSLFLIILLVRSILLEHLIIGINYAIIGSYLLECLENFSLHHSIIGSLL